MYGLLPYRAECTGDGKLKLKHDFMEIFRSLVLWQIVSCMTLDLNVIGSGSLEGEFQSRRVLAGFVASEASSQIRLGGFQPPCVSVLLSFAGVSFNNKV